MSRSWNRMQVVFAALAVMSLATVANAAAPAKPKGLGDPGALTSLKVEPNLAKKGITMRGRDARQQLYVTGVFSSGQLRDFTHKVKYSVAPAGVLKVDATGLATPSTDGVAVVTATAGGKSSTLKITVEGVTRQIPINFKNQIVPIFTKLGCNSGGCHGKASGQNGFKLSLLGFYPGDDYEFLVKEGRGRRLSSASPGESLLLLKAVGRSPHGGGKRMDVDSHEYRLIYRWVEQGMPRGSAADPVVSSIKCYPVTRVMDRGSDQQISTLATYSDGTVEDVTRMALYEANDTEMAEATVTGLIKTLDLAGEVAIMARYQGQVSTFRATIPLGADVAAMPPSKNLVDKAVFGKLKLLGIPASPVAGDATFLRRIYVDVTGGLPSAKEVAKFLADEDPKKRDKAIDRLLDSSEYADYFTNKWNMVLRNKKRGNDDTGSTYAFYRWIWNSLYNNKPYDEFVRLQIAGDHLQLETGGQRWHLSHGDLFGTADTGYLRLRRILRSPWFRWLARHLPMFVSRWLARMLRMGSRRALRHKEANRLKPDRDAIKQLIDAGYDRVVCGHFHRAQEERIDGDKEVGDFTVLEPFEDRGAHLFVEDGNLEMRYVEQS